MTVRCPEILNVFARELKLFWSNAVLEEKREQWKKSLYAIKGQSYSSLFQAFR